MGHSAGAHLVALLNAQPALAQRAGAAPWLGAVSLDSAVLDLPALMGAPHAPLYDEAFGDDPAYWAALSPYDQLVPGAAPFQFVCSTVRPDHPCQQAVHMARRVREAGGRASAAAGALAWRHQRYPGAGQRLHAGRGNVHGLARRRSGAAAGTLTAQPGMAAEGADRRAPLPR